MSNIICYEVEIFSFGHYILISRKLLCVFVHIILTSFKSSHESMSIIRLTTDIQDFKSSFKQVISQGLRSVTQVIGGSITLYTLSPKLTSLMVLVLPGIILIGSGLGSLLRNLSKSAQEQISLAMAVADEAVGNIRTVRAFAMEHQEIG